MIFLKNKLTLYWSQVYKQDICQKFIYIAVYNFNNAKMFYMIIIHDTEGIMI